MKLLHGIPFISILLQLKSVQSQMSACVVGGFSVEFDGECDYNSFYEAYEILYNESECTHTVQEDIALQLGLAKGASDTKLHSAVRDICIGAWDKARKVPFDDTHMKGEQFTQLFYNGGTEWNEEVETKLETGEATNVLRQDASRVKQFYNSLAQTDHLEWPGDLPNFDLNECHINAAMCCWPQDRQANDGNGNCATPYDVNCYDKDPADNTDLCFADISRSSHPNNMNGTGFVNFPFDNSNGEGAIHCHGFAWSSDEYDSTSRYKANNLFFVSMYDHMHQRGYVGNIPGAPMCACVEQMPTVTRSDCTQIDVDESYKFVHYPDDNKFVAELTKVDIDFNSCQGRYNRNNNLHAYVARLADEGKMTNDQRSGLDKYLVGSNRCPYAIDYMMGENGFVKGFYHDSNVWFKVAGSDSLYEQGIGREGFRTLLKDSPYQIVWRVCASCVPSHQNVYYKRYTPVPDSMDLLNMMLNGWTNTNNVANVDFKIYSTFDDAVNDENPWTFYAFSGDKGFPYESGPTQRVRDQWRSFRHYWGRTDVAFYVMKNDGVVGLNYFIAPETSGGLSSQDIGNVGLMGGVTTKDDKYYITAAGSDIWSYYDHFHYLAKSIHVEGDIMIKAYISSLTKTDNWTKGGLMVRESLASNSAHFFCFLSGNQGVTSHDRPETGSWTRTQSYSHGIAIKPTWLMISKTMDSYTCSKSDDGVEWTQVGNPVTLQMKTETIHVGMALTSHNDRLLGEMVVENYEMQTSFYPSASPTLSRSPTYKYFTDGITTITNVYSSRMVYANGNSGESGVGAQKNFVHPYTKWSIIPVTCNAGKDCYFIKSYDKNRCLYAETGKDWQAGVGGGPCDSENSKWYLEKACGGDCFFVINAENDRRLYAQADTHWESGFGAVIGNHCDDQKWYIEWTS